jgi:hypothetical protein
MKSQSSHHWLRGQRELHQYGQLICWWKNSHGRVGSALGPRVALSDLYFRNPKRASGCTGSAPLCRRVWRKQKGDFEPDPTQELILLVARSSGATQPEFCNLKLLWGRTSLYNRGLRHP